MPTVFDTRIGTNRASNGQATFKDQSAPEEEAARLELLTEEDDERFTEGSCGELAKALHERTGWPIVLVADGTDGPAGWVHAAVQSPDGRVLDVMGWHDPDVWLGRWMYDVTSRGERTDGWDDRNVAVVLADEWNGGGWDPGQEIDYIESEAIRVAAILVP